MTENTETPRALRCAMSNRDCFGEVARYSFDIDLPPLVLCQRHVLAISGYEERRRHERLAIADEVFEPRADD